MASPGQALDDAAPTGGGPRRPSKYTLARTLRYLLLLIGLLFVMIPVYVLFITSFKGVGDATPARAWLLPAGWTLDNWKAAWDQLAPSIGRSVAMVRP